MGQLINGTPGNDNLAETSDRGDTLVGGAGNDTYTWYASFWYDPGFPEYGIPGETIYYRTHIQELPGQGKDTKRLRSATPLGFARAFFEANQ